VAEGDTVVGDDGCGDTADNDEGGAAGVSLLSRLEGASSITVTSTLFLGDGDLDLDDLLDDQGGKGDPPVDDPSGEGLSMDGDGEGEVDTESGEETTKWSLESTLLDLDDFGVSGLDAPGDIEVGLADRWLEDAGASDSVSVEDCCTGDEGEELVTEDEDEEMHTGSSSCSWTGGGGVG